MEDAIRRFKERVIADHARPSPQGCSYVAGGPVSLVGEGLPRSPKLKANAFASYTAMIGDDKTLTFAVDAMCSSRFNNDMFDSFPNESYTVVNANIRFAPVNSRWSVNVYGRNLFNEVYTTASVFQDSIGELQFFDPPRTIGVQLGFKY